MIPEGWFADRHVDGNLYFSVLYTRGTGLGDCPITIVKRKSDHKYWLSPARVASVREEKGPYPTLKEAVRVAETYLMLNEVPVEFNQ